MVPESWHREQMSGRIRMRRLYAEKIFQLKESQQENQELRNALETAVIGLEWWNESYPEGSSETDNEHIKYFKQLLQTKQNKEG